MKKKPNSRIVVVLIAVALAAITYLAFARVLDCGFLKIDDNMYVTEDAHVQAGLTAKNVAWAFATTTEANWHPLVWLSLMADYRLHGLDARGFHLTNLLIHILNAVLLFLVLRKMTASTWKTAFVAALFAVHPLHVESVAWIAERKDMLSGLFWILTMGAYAWYVGKPSAGRYVLVLMAFACGLMSKSVLITLPLALLLLDYWPLRRVELGLPRLLLEKLPLLVSAVAVGVVTMCAQQNGGAMRSWEAVSLGERVANALISYVAYIAKMVVPVGLAAFYPRHESGIPVWQSLGAALILAGISVIVFRARRRAPFLAVGWLWYLITLAPMIGIIQVGEQAMADRYTYIPLIGIWVAVTWLVTRRVRRRFSHSPALVALATGVIAVLCVLTRIQTGYWQDSVTLFSHAAAVTRNNYIAYQHIGAALMSDGDLDGAVEYLSKAVKIKPDYPVARVILGNTLQRQDKLDEAIASYRAAIKGDPKYVPSYSNLGSALMRQGKVEAAVRAYRDAIRVDASFALAHANLAMALGLQGKLKDAVAEDEKAVALDAQAPEFSYGMAMHLNQLGRRDQAIEEYRRCLALKPDFMAARNDLAVALYFAGRYADAWKQVHAMTDTGGAPSPDFLLALSKKLPDPGE